MSYKATADYILDEAKGQLLLNTKDKMINWFIELKTNITILKCEDFSVSIPREGFIRLTPPPEKNVLEGPMTIEFEYKPNGADLKIETFIKVPPKLMEYVYNIDFSKIKLMKDFWGFRHKYPNCENFKQSKPNVDILGLVNDCLWISSGKGNEVWLESYAMLHDTVHYTIEWESRNVVCAPHQFIRIYNEKVKIILEAFTNSYLLYVNDRTLVVPLTPELDENKFIKWRIDVELSPKGFVHLYYNDELMGKIETDTTGKEKTLLEFGIGGAPGVITEYKNFIVRCNGISENFIW